MGKRIYNLIKCWSSLYTIFFKYSFYLTRYSITILDSRTNDIKHFLNATSLRTVKDTMEREIFEERREKGDMSSFFN